MNKTTKNKIAKIILKNFKDKEQAVTFIEGFPLSLDGTIYLSSFDSKKDILTFEYQLLDKFGNDEGIYGSDLDSDLVEKTIDEILPYFTGVNTLKVSCADDKDFKGLIENLPSLDQFCCDRVELVPFELYEPDITYDNVYDQEKEDTIDSDTDDKYNLSTIFEVLNNVINNYAFDLFVDIRDIIEKSK